MVNKKMGTKMGNWEKNEIKDMNANRMKWNMNDDKNKINDSK